MPQLIQTLPLSLTRKVSENSGPQSLQTQKESFRKLSENVINLIEDLKQEG